MIRCLFLVFALAAPAFQLNLQPYSVNGSEAHRPKRYAPTTENQGQCGNVILVPQTSGGGSTPLEGQWPWHVAVYHTRKVDSTYSCGGTLLSPRHVLTAAHCVTKWGSKTPKDKTTLTVHLGKHNLKTSFDGVQLKLVEKITVHPDFDSSTYSRNVAILELHEPVAFTNWVQPVCLWPDNQDDLSTIIGKRGTVVGWGVDENGELSEELKLVEMPVVDQETCIRSYSEFFVRFTSEYTYCAENNKGVSVCNGDSGGGMVFRSGDSWYLRGLVSLSVAKKDKGICDPSHYVIFADIAKILPWVKQNVHNI